MSEFDDTTVILTTPELQQPCEVLLVDDDELVRERMALLLQKAGYLVTLVQSGDEALQMLDIQRYSVLITDWEMPDMDGLALIRKVRQRRGEGYVYILLLTIRDGKRDVVTGLQAGADDYILKGAPPEELLARLETARRITILEHSLRNAYQENRRLATIDPLTGVRNRRYLMKYLPREYQRCRRYNHPIAVIACDLDHFKLVNDRYGHDVGDEVLREFCTRAQAQLRESDWLSRSGGEEFIAVLPETDLAGAEVVAERVRGALASQPIRTGAGPLSASVSIGVAAIDATQTAGHLDHTALLSAADECLYRSKEAGRNRITGIRLQR